VFVVLHTELLMIEKLFCDSAGSFLYSTNNLKNIGFNDHSCLDFDARRLFTTEDGEEAPT